MDSIAVDPVHFALVDPEEGLLGVGVLAQVTVEADLVTWLLYYMLILVERQKTYTHTLFGIEQDPEPGIYIMQKTMVGGEGGGGKLRIRGKN